MSNDKELRAELEIMRERKTDERVTSETIFRLRKEKNELRDLLRSLIERCDELEAANGIKVSNLDDGSSWARIGNAVIAGKELLKRV